MEYVEIGRFQSSSVRSAVRSIFKLVVFLAVRYTVLREYIEIGRFHSSSVHSAVQNIFKLVGFLAVQYTVLSGIY